jgi:hypothetical protein
MDVMPVHLCKFVRSVAQVCSLETLWASECAGESHSTSCPHSMHALLICCFSEAIFCVADNEWANLVAWKQGSHVNTFQTLLPLKNNVKIHAACILDFAL